MAAAAIVKIALANAVVMAVVTATQPICGTASRRACGLLDATSAVRLTANGTGQAESMIGEHLTVRSDMGIFARRTTNPARGWECGADNTHVPPLKWWATGVPQTPASSTAHAGGRADTALQLCCWRRSIQ